MTALDERPATETPAGLLALQEEVPARLIGKLPKVTCPDCRKKENKGACAKHAKRRCGECGGWLTSEHTHLDYVGHAETTSKLLEVDPLWNWEPLAFGDDGLPVFDANGGLWIRLTVCGVTRLGYGTADNANGFKAVGDIKKEIIGDAIRNAAMRYGWALNLWAKADIHERQEQGGQDAEAPKRQRSQSNSVQRSKPTEPAGEWNGETAPQQRPVDQPASRAQLNALAAVLAKKRGNLSRPERLGAVAKLVGRALASSADLTKREASRVIDLLNDEPDHAAPAEQVPEGLEQELRSMINDARTLEQLDDAWAAVQNNAHLGLPPEQVQRLTAAMNRRESEIKQAQPVGAAA